ncbi:M20/M25/M40 family metallo-hydrolase [Propionibacteriaceae bacterium G1746]|uniref:M20/M25/M40 family metallo-hydrolase n=1 Tax=Aestuariimicrobium sp. G57 TaxID=3418485 RepID=UPI003C1BB846
MQTPAVATTLATLIRFAPVNHGGGRSDGERAIAEWIADQLRAAGWAPLLLHRAGGRDRLNVVLRVPGADRSLPGLLVHAHTDVVPVEPDQWTVPPFEGLVRAGYVYGRGAMDMLGTVAVLVETLVAWGRDGTRPRRDVLFCFVADEEDAGHWGAEWLVGEHPELFEGIEVAIGEEGGMGELMPHRDGSTRRVYTIQAGERGTQHIALTARGDSGHGSRPTGDDAITRLLHALVRISDHEWPLAVGDVVRGQYEGLAAALGFTVDITDEASMLALVDHLGPLAGPMRWTIRPSATPTVVQAGYKMNVVPGQASAQVDVRCPPGTVDLVDATLHELIGDGVEWHYLVNGAPLASPTSGPWWQAMCATIMAHDPAAVVVPGCMGGGTDAKAFATLGITTYGFTPAPPDASGRFAAGYHGSDERYPVASLVGAQTMMRHFLATV